MRSEASAARPSRIVPIVLAALAGMAGGAWGMSADEYLKAQPKPVFREGHTLPRLTRFGWTLPFEARVRLAADWGYALEFGGYATAKSAEALADPNSMESKLCALAAGDPNRYALGVICSRELPADPPPETWVRDAEGNLIDGKRNWSPEAPDEVLRQAAELRAAPLRAIRAKAPIAIVLNGGEYALSVPGFIAAVCEKDPRIMKAKGDRPWFDYISERKARQEMIISEAVRKAVPDRQLYIYYTTSGGEHRNRYGGWKAWCWGYEWMQPVSDLPSSESYYKHFNSGWTGGQDMLTLLLNARGFEISRGQPLCYNWLCAGWTRGSTGDQGLGDIVRYTGFLKCCYAAGMVGGNAGYYTYPPGGFGAPFEPDAPPHWLLQMAALGRVHALFSHLEKFLREGDLLPGPDKHRWSKDQPAYEFPAGDPDARVLVRKLRKADRWLIAAWAAGGDERTVRVEVPALGRVSLLARPAGSVYAAALEDGKPALTLVDADAMLPSAKIPAGLP